MRKAARHPELAMIVFAQFHCNVATECRAADTDVNGHVEHTPAQRAHQLSLGSSGSAGEARVARRTLIGKDCPARTAREYRRRRSARRGTFRKKSHVDRRRTFGSMIRTSGISVWITFMTVTELSGSARRHIAACANPLKAILQLAYLCSCTTPAMKPLRARGGEKQ